MPIYEYQCEDCRKIFETIVKQGKKIILSCPDCGSKNLRKLLSACSYIGGDRASVSSSCVGCSATSCSTCGK